MKSLSKSIQLGATALASVIALTACGGGGSSTPATAGSPGASVSQGVVTAKGSVFVNGIEFSTAGADITIDGVAGKADADLKVGMVVKVSGASDDATKLGKALKIEARDAVEGKIEVGGIDNAAKTITVMGQKVQIEDNLTNLNDDATKVFATAGFVVDDTVEVHGFVDDQGRLRATRVAKKATGEFETKGIVTTVGATSFTLSTPGRTGVLTVNFSSPLVAPALNSMVEVKTLTVPAAGATTITASSIRLEDNLGAENEKVEVEGLVSTFTSAQDFVVNGKQKVTTDASTVFEGGMKADLAAGMKVEAEGPLKNGVIAATKISFRSNIRIEGVATVTASGLTLLGKSITISKFTTRQDLFISGDQVEVRAMLDRDGNLVATRVIKRSNVDGKAFLQGPVSVDAAGAVSILGTTIVTDAATQFRVSTDSTEAAVTKDAFIAKAKIKGTVVKVRWDNFTAVTVPVKEAEIELGKL